MKRQLWCGLCLVWEPGSRVVKLQHQDEVLEQHNLTVRHPDVVAACEKMEEIEERLMRAAGACC